MRSTATRTGVKGAESKYSGHRSGGEAEMIGYEEEVKGYVHEALPYQVSDKWELRNGIEYYDGI